jgi:hypothetical protein
MVDGVNVNIEGPVPRAVIHFEQAALCRPARAMHKHVQPPKLRNGLLHAAGGFGGRRNIGRDRQRTALQGRYIRLHALGELFVGGKPAHRDVRPTGSQLACRSCSYAAATSCDQANLPV